jgi:hypothetical protein
MSSRRLVWCLATLLVAPAWAGAQPSIDGPDPPAGSAVVARDDRGRATVRAARLPTPLSLDGRLDEEIYSLVAPVGGFIQQLPRQGVPATEPTELWIFFDDENVYVAARCHDSQPSRIVANERRRDSRSMFQLNDNLTIVFDTFYDRRNGFFFQTNPVGAVRDQAIKDGAQNESWNTVWDVRAHRSDAGYTVEMVIPFKSLRYRNAGPQVWGVNVRRIVKWKNEVSNLTLVPASYGQAGVSQMGVAATLVGLETPARGKNLELKPYAVTALTTDRAARIPFANDGSLAGGFDAKYGLTRGLTADLTVNTDFAQVEEDQQQINLTRFNLQFPEKREFFLEGQGIFDFGGVTGQNGGGNVPVLLFSRRIGLSNGQAVPVIAGGRVTGKAGKFDVGALMVRTGDKPAAGAIATNFSAVRLRREILRRSSVGMIATGRWPALAGSGENQAVGVDADLRFFDNVQTNLSWARTASPGRAAQEASYRGSFGYGGDRYGLEIDHVLVGRNFNPEVGFVRRSDISSTAASVHFSPRLSGSRLIRRLSWKGGFEYVTDAARTTLTDRTQAGAFGIEFNNSDQFSLSASRLYEFVPVDFGIAAGVVVPRGGYSTDSLSASYSLGGQRPVSGTISGSFGSFYDGSRTTAGYSGRVSVSARLVLEPSVTLNWVRLPQGDFTARLVGTRLSVTPTPRLGIGAFVQFNPAARLLSSSARLRWEYTPGSELFVVYSDGRNTATAGYPGLVNRSFAVKATKLLRF